MIQLVVNNKKKACTSRADALYIIVKLEKKASTLIVGEMPNLQQNYPRQEVLIMQFS